MSSVCAVAGCKNKLTAQNPNVTYFPFPADIKNKVKWMIKVFGTVDFKQSDAHICSAHFKKDDFVKDPGAKSSNLPLNLKENAVPSLNLRAKTRYPSGKTTVLPNTNNPSASPVGIIIYQYNIQDSNIQNSTIQSSNIQTGNNKIEDSTKLTNQIKIKDKMEERLENKIIALKTDLKAEKHKCSLLQRKMKELRNKVEELHTDAAEMLEEDWEDKIHKMVKNLSSKTQFEEALISQELNNGDWLKNIKF